MTDSDPLGAPRDPDTEEPSKDEDEVPEPTTPSTEAPAPGESDEHLTDPDDAPETPQVVGDEADPA